MFESFYGFTQTPFARDIPTEQLYSSIMLEETLGRLEYAASRQLFAVVTGDCGTGKTTTIRRFKDMLDSARFHVMYLADSKLTPRHFYKGLLEQLGAESKFYRGDAKRQLHREVELMRGIHRLQIVVIIDEAHLLDREMLEEVRFLLNFKMDAQSPMALILVYFWTLYLSCNNGDLDTFDDELFEGKPHSGDSFVAVPPPAAQPADHEVIGGRDV
ncbi:conserved hypothetical protein [Heliomicrobium modesticaldum Ice1]|uniref:ORC1/DEAH AAA+ ATPase domain-containing protein n=1 Tax=Heliobacterium modesticaldum (strain ATCC 51547 / Ice1) TaxID=498761 RepID=B0TDA2_HELMI|nr:conserved hypothetical protein [Heliomicrobium modesticaldum Ice1]